MDHIPSKSGVKKKHAYPCAPCMEYLPTFTISTKCRNEIYLDQLELIFQIPFGILTWLATEYPEV